MNLMLAIFNLLPGAPLDGGRVVRAVVWRRSGDRLRGAAAAARGGRGIGLALILVGGAELLLLRSAAGLWLMVLGWFLRGAAHAELTNAVTRQRLGTAAVSDIMTDRPLAVSSEMAVADFLRSAAPCTSHRVFPVVDGEGHPVGVLSLSDLVRESPTIGPGATIGSRARRLPRGATIDQHALLTDALSRVILRPGVDLIAATDHHGRLAGIVTAADLANACDRSALGLTVSRTATEPTPAQRFPRPAASTVAPAGPARRHAGSNSRSMRSHPS
jgi:CBS domain-containing protein